MNKIKLIVSDLDGTLIPEGTQELEPGFFEVLDALLERGIGFMAASGRAYSSMKNLFSEYTDRISFLCENGALVMENGDVVLKKTLPLEAARAISSDLIANPNVDVQLSGTSVTYISPRTEWFFNTQKYAVKNNVVTIKSFDDIPEPLIKIACHIYDFEKNAASIRQEMMDRYSAYGDFVYAGNGFLDLLPNNTGKGQALKELMDKEGLAPDEIMVFGDNENDMSMLALSPNSYAKSNSAPNVKAIAAHECDSVTEILKSLL
jgi:hypothetical protein